MRKIRNILVLNCLFLLSVSSLYGQIDVDEQVSYPPVDENKIVETKWRYTYAVHTESNTIIHKADNAYDYFLYFRYDYTYQEFLNGKLTKGTWSLNEAELFYNFRNINKFWVAEINKEILVLEFTPPNSKGSYQYHFVSVTSEEAPFIKPPNELPDVIVEINKSDKKNKNSPSWWKRRKDKKKKKKEKKDEVYISVELVGGGYYGGIDPVIRDYIQIKSTGRIIKEFKSVNQGLVVKKKNITREELENLAEFIIAQKFFDYDRLYDCDTELCQRRQRAKPTPIPLRLAVVYGNRKNIVTVTIWGKDEQKVKYVNYPKGLDEIIFTIQALANE